MVKWCLIFALRLFQQCTLAQQLYTPKPKVGENCSFHFFFFKKIVYFYWDRELFHVIINSVLMPLVVIYFMLIY